MTERKHFTGGLGGGGSNPLAPTIFSKNNNRLLEKAAVRRQPPPCPRRRLADRTNAVLRPGQGRYRFPDTDSGIAPIEHRDIP
jgi:hypothetical protein